MTFPNIGSLDLCTYILIALTAWYDHFRAILEGGSSEKSEHIAVARPMHYGLEDKLLYGFGMEVLKNDPPFVCWRVLFFNFPGSIFGSTKPGSKYLKTHY